MSRWYRPGDKSVRFPSIFMWFGRQEPISSVVISEVTRLLEAAAAGFRLWYEDVIGVYYRVDESNLRVEVLYAGPARRR